MVLVMVYRAVAVAGAVVVVRVVAVMAVDVFVG